MCMFCAAIPATAAVGAKLNASQRAHAQEPSDACEKPANRPVRTITGVVIVLLAIGSIWYNTHFSTFI